LHRGAGCCSLGELLVRKLYRWTRPCFSLASPTQVPLRTRVKLPPSTPPTLKPQAVFGPFLAPRTPPNSGQKNPSPVAPSGGRSGQSGTLLEATGGTQTHSRRTRSKLGQLRCARQALVRVPESNTKYGGNLGKTGGARHPQCCQVSVSPQGFPSEKNCWQRADLSFAPLFTGQLFIPLQGLPRRDSREATGVSGLACPAIDGLALR
jgi:hypothetical protein